MANKIATRRQQDILAELYEKGQVSVNDLSDRFRVNPITIRRDLDVLAKEGKLERVHGGAVINSNQLNEFGFDEKSIAHRESKRRIAEAAAKLVPEGATLFLNSGSTSAEIVHYLGQGEHTVRVITNNAAISQVECNTKVEVYLCGGVYRPCSKSLVGEMALATLSTVFSSYTILGANGVSVEQGITTAVQRETAINKKMIEQSQGPLVVAVDSSKIGRVSSFQTESFDRIDILITDTDIDPVELKKLQKTNKKIILV